MPIVGRDQLSNWSFHFTVESLIPIDERRRDSHDWSAVTFQKHSPIQRVDAFGVNQSVAFAWPVSSDCMVLRHAQESPGIERRDVQIGME